MNVDESASAAALASEPVAVRTVAIRVLFMAVLQNG
jgi:hypothetical protein